MTQKERVFSMLKRAGTNGVSSKEFIASYMPRAAARIQELKDSGVEISSEREGKFCRYTLVRVGAGQSSEQSVHASADSDETPTLFELEPPRAYNPLRDSEAA